MCELQPSLQNLVALIQQAPFPIVNIIAERFPRQPASSNEAKSKKLQGPRASSAQALEKELAEVKRLMNDNV